MREMTVASLERIAANAIGDGYGRMIVWRDSPDGVSFRRSFEVHCEMDCSDAGCTELWARYPGHGWRRVGDKLLRPEKNPIRVFVYGQCRKCANCKERRAMLWRGRAMDEFDVWPRTLMGTITMSPEQHFLQDVRVIERLASQAVNWSDLSESERFTERVREFGPLLQRWFKRLRKGDTCHVKPRFRYLLVCERHDSENTSDMMRGRPHFHMLLHEVDVGALVCGDPQIAIEDGQDGEYEGRKVKVGREWSTQAFVKDDAFIRKNWPFGFTKFQWASSARSASYVCKYLSKGMDDRIRASLHYGACGSDIPGGEADQRSSVNNLTPLP